MQAMSVITYIDNNGILYRTPAQYLQLTYRWYGVCCRQEHVGPFQLQFLLLNACLFNAGEVFHQT